MKVGDADPNRAVEWRALPVRELLRLAAGPTRDPAPLSLELLAGESGLERTLESNRIQKSGLALAGHAYGIEPGRVQILGVTELTYLEGLGEVARRRTLEGYFDLGLAAVVATDASRTLAAASPLRRDLMDAAEASDTPLLASRARSSETLLALHTLLDRTMAPRRRVHGVLVDVYEVGLLLLGASGVGKSEVALELVMRGHRLVADDVVECQAAPSPYSSGSAESVGAVVFGEPPEALRHHLEVRGLGILDVKRLFGVTAVRDRKRIDVVVRLVERDVIEDRLGLERRHHELLGVAIPERLVPVRAGRDMASILEVAARSHLLERAGESSLSDAVARIESAVRAKAPFRGGG